LSQKANYAQDTPSFPDDGLGRNASRRFDEEGEISVDKFSAYFGTAI